jgi:hypothetical protein
MIDRSNHLEAWDRDHFFHPSTHMAAHARGDTPNRVIATGEGLKPLVAAIYKLSELDRAQRDFMAKASWENSSLFPMPNGASSDLPSPTLTARPAGIRASGCERPSGCAVPH